MRVSGSLSPKTAVPFFNSCRLLVVLLHHRHIPRSLDMAKHHHLVNLLVSATVKLLAVATVKLLVVATVKQLVPATAKLLATVDKRQRKPLATVDNRRRKPLATVDNRQRKPPAMAGLPKALATVRRRPFSQLQTNQASMAGLCPLIWPCEVRMPHQQGSTTLFGNGFR